MSSVLHFCGLVLFLNVSPVRQSQKITVTCNHVNRPEEMRVFDTSTNSPAAIIKECAPATNISLQGATTFTVNGLSEIYVNHILGIRHIEMCVLVENTTARYIIAISETITGSCEGPLLTIVNNPYLNITVFKDELFESVKNLRPGIRIRGNKGLNEVVVNALWKYAANNESVDIQVPGECSLPIPFISFEALDRSCSFFYGPLRLKKGTSEVLYNASEVHRFEFEGCVQIEKTELKDITFLNAFSRFKPIPSCAQFIRDNKNLCYANLNYLNDNFKNIKIYNNSEQKCSKCLGGKVSERYLDESKRCSLIHGDLLITGLRGIPPNIEILQRFESIEGRLIIANNTGLNRFDYLSSLRKVGVQNALFIGVAAVLILNSSSTLGSFNIQRKKRTIFTAAIKEATFEV